MVWQIHMQNILRISLDVNGLAVYNTIGGGECFYDAVAQSLKEIGINRSIADLRTITASQLELQENVFRPLYFVADEEDEQINRQAPTFDLFVERTRHGKEWATDMCYPALALGLNMTLRVVATTIAKDGTITAHYQDYNDGVQVTDAASVVVVGCNTVEGHYIGFGTMPLFVIERPVSNENDAVLASDNSQSVCNAKKRKTLIASLMVVVTQITIEINFECTSWQSINSSSQTRQRIRSFRRRSSVASSLQFKKPDIQNKQQCQQCQKYFVNLDNHKVCRSKNICHQSTYQLQPTRFSVHPICIQHH